MKHPLPCHFAARYARHWQMSCAHAWFGNQSACHSCRAIAREFCLPVKTAAQAVVPEALSSAAQAPPKHMEAAFLCCSSSKSQFESQSRSTESAIKNSRTSPRDPAKFFKWEICVWRKQRRRPGKAKGQHKHTPLPEGHTMSLSSCWTLRA